MIDKEELVDFLFWLQYDEQKNLLYNWLNAMASNRHVAQLYIESNANEAR